MIHFAQAQYLLLLLLIPFLFVVYALVMKLRQRRIRKFGDENLVSQLMPSYAKGKAWVRLTLFSVGFFFFVIGLSRPQIGAKLKEHETKGAEIMIVLDVSNSMLAEDYSPNRLERAKLAISRLVDKLRDDRIGLIVFAGNSFVQLPITSDYVSAKMFLSNIDPSLIATQGTDIARAIDMATKSFTKQDKVGRAIIVITDGEDHEGGAKEAAAAAYKKGINVFVLGIGDPKGSPIPMANGGYMTDSRGETVMSALNTQMCREIAQAGSGTYIHVDNTSDAQEDLNEGLTKLQRGETDSVIYSEFDEQFQAFGILVILLLIIEVCLLEVKNPTLGKIKLFKRK